MTVDQAEHLSALISDIYDAALDHSLWTSVLGKAGDFVGGVSAALLSRTPSTEPATTTAVASTKRSGDSYSTSS